MTIIVGASIYRSQESSRNTDNTMSEALGKSLTLVDVCLEKANSHGNRVAYRFLQNGEIERSSLTYGDLDRQARSIASRLQSLTPADARIVLVYPYEAGLEFIAAFFGCLYAGRVAVPCHPPRDRNAGEDLQARLVDSGASAVLTDKNSIARLKTALPGSHHWLATDMIPDSAAGDWSEPAIGPDSLAFLQYTSGSTGKPKGVMVSHERVLHNQRLLQLAFRHTDEAIGVGWLPLFHDMGLIGNVIQALYLGRPSILMSPIAFIQKPSRWLEAISRYRATTSGAPNFAYDLLCRHVSDDIRRKLDLSSWDVAFSGAEPIRAETINRFSRLFAPSGFRPEAFFPCYGMAEAVLFITGGEKTKFPTIRYASEGALKDNRVVTLDQEKEGFRSLVGCGQTWFDGQIAIVDPRTLTHCPADGIGEIWVAGSGSGLGYWNDRPRTEETFEAYIWDTGEGPFLRTGDLGFLQDGELFVTGRLHDVMVFWGLNHYPQLLEETIESCHRSLRSNGTATFSSEIDGEDRLIVATEVERSDRNSIKVGEVAEIIRWQLFEKHLIDVYEIVFLKPGSLPRTSSGKIQRHACKQQFIEGNLSALGRWQRSSEQATDITSVIRYYFNPLVHLRRYWLILRSRIERFLSLIK